MNMRMKWLENPGCWVFSDGSKIGVPYTDCCIRSNRKYRVVMMHYSHPWLENNGYYRVSVRGKRYELHRLLAEAFIPNPLNKPVVDHIDRNPANNSLSNLRWATHKENSDNSKSVDSGLSKYGVRCCEDKKEYMRQWTKINRPPKRPRQ